MDSQTADQNLADRQLVRWIGNSSIGISTGDEHIAQ